MSATIEPKPVVVSLKDLETNTVPFSALEEAFGPSSLGILIVKNLPSSFPAKRSALLSQASYLANLPDKDLQSLESSESKYLTGWSLGKETLSSGRFDTLKGSYYSNCTFYSRPSEAEQARITKAYPSFLEYTAPNIWPEGSLPFFQPAFEALCIQIIDVAILVAAACDRYGTARIEGYKTNTLERVVKESHTTKARLLHYFPRKADPSTESSGGAKQDEDDWCATHLDHGCLTGLTAAMFVDEAAELNYTHLHSASASDQLLEELPTSPDPAAGLYIRGRTGETVKVNIPRDCLAFQTGEALEVITRGRFKAVPHFVRGPRRNPAAAQGKGGGVARNTLAVFTQPNLDYMVDETRTFADFARDIVAKNTKM